MARYIDADKVMEEIERIGGHNLCEWETIGVKALIDRQPTADVAPKSEVEKLRKDNEDLRNILANTLNKYRNCETEVAREIFEEIAIIGVLQHGFNEKHIVMHIDFELLKELKKKYTEGNNG